MKAPMLIKGNKALGIAFILLCFCIPAQSQADFDKAHSLLEQMSRDRAEAKTEQDKEHLSQEVNTVPAEVERLVNNGILEALNTSNPSSVSRLQQILNSILNVDVSEENPRAFIFALGSQPKPFFLAAYNIAYCAVCGRSWIGVFGQRDNRYHVVTGLENPFPNQSMTVVPLGASAEANPNFLVYGTNWGDPHKRLNATIYEFDGHQLRTVWSRSSLAEGKIDLMPGKLVLSFFTTLRPPFTERTEIYNVIPEGVQLQSGSEQAVK